MVASTERLAERKAGFEMGLSLKTEWIAVGVAGISILIAVVATLIATLAIADAKEASIRSQMQTQEIQALRDEVAVLEIRVINAENEQ